MKSFDTQQLEVINNSVALAEELVSEHYKMSASQWLDRKYDIKTLAELEPQEIVEGPFAQIIRYRGQRKNTLLKSGTYDFYKICLQDHSIIRVLDDSPQIELFPFALYITTHELIHIVRFSEFRQQFDATAEEKLREETHVHQRTHDILNPVQVPGLPAVLTYYHEWRSYHRNGPST